MDPYIEVEVELVEGDLDMEILSSIYDLGSRLAEGLED